MVGGRKTGVRVWGLSVLGEIEDPLSVWLGGVLHEESSVIFFLKRKFETLKKRGKQEMPAS